MLYWKYMSVEKLRKCPICSGFGKCDDGSPCPTCEGTGEVPADEPIVDDPCWPMSARD